MDSKKLISTLATLAIFVCIFGIVLASYDSDIDTYGSDLIANDGPDMLYAAPDKRGMCRDGWAYSVVLRRCMPSLGILRGRGKGKGRLGRRGVGRWRF